MSNVCIISRSQHMLNRKDKIDSTLTVMDCLSAAGFKSLQVNVNKKRAETRATVISDVIIWCISCLTLKQTEYLTVGVTEKYVTKDCGETTTGITPVLWHFTDTLINKVDLKTAEWFIECGVKHVKPAGLLLICAQGLLPDWPAERCCCFVLQEQSNILALVGGDRKEKTNTPKVLTPQCASLRTPVQRCTRFTPQGFYSNTPSVHSVHLRRKGVFFFVDKWLYKLQTWPILKIR